MNDQKNKVAKSTKKDDGLVWPRAILLMDMNCFFSAIEQRDFPELKALPVAVTNGLRGTCIITSSYEARAYGVKTGMRLPEARMLCPHLIQRPSRPNVYAEISRLIMHALKNISPDMEVFSIDEAFLDLTHCQKLHGSVWHMAKMTQKLVKEVSGLPCSIGVSGDKSTAKYAAKVKKPNGITIIPPWQARQRLQNVAVTELCGVNKGVARFLAKRNVYTCGDMQALPVSELARRFGNVGRKIWLMAQAKDNSPVKMHVAAPKSIGHGKVMPPGTQDKKIILRYLYHMVFKVAARLRKHRLQASVFFVALKSRQHKLAGRAHIAWASNDTKVIYAACLTKLMNLWQGEAVSQIQVTALNPRTEGQRLLFASNEVNHLDQVSDRINQRYGQYCILPASLLGRSDMPDVIAPAWQPDGVRQTIVS